MQLKEPRLLREQAWIDGQWCDAADGRRFAVDDPATGATIGHVPDMGVTETERAIAAAARAQRAWAAQSAKARAAVLRRWFDLIVAHVDDLAHIMVREQGKPLAEAKAEVLYGASFVEWFAEEGKRAYGDVIPSLGADRRFVVIKQPIGVCAAITPWNFPLAMITRKCAPGLAVGCSFVVKPAEQTPFCALALAVLAEEAGLPAGVFNVLTTLDAPAVGATLCASPVVRKLSFTGSTEVGRILMRQSAGTVKKLGLELGGNASFIVFDDADLDAAVDGAIASKYRNSGQTCVCANRIYVQDGIYDRFAAKLTENVRQLKVGQGFEDGVVQGPLIDAQALAKVEAHVADAVQHGARVLTGGRPHARGGRFYEPTVLADVTPAMRVSVEETFGPVAPLFRFADETEVVRLANASEFGLASYFYSRDIGRVWRVAEALEVGIVGVNTGLISNELVPFGGVKQSGLGREGSKYGIDDYLEIKYICMGGL
ncbi:MAG: NAD-dependent succinate-semialdehyde dehydrogenase [Burkholderiales bacterium]|nr:NAD-dependent succinate-semialdehyde dehydrogenase [Burkholderiales bacterium]